MPCFPGFTPVTALVQQTGLRMGYTVVSSPIAAPLRDNPPAFPQVAGDGAAAEAASGAEADDRALPHRHARGHHAGLWRGPPTRRLLGLAVDALGDVRLDLLGIQDLAPQTFQRALAIL